MANDHMASEQQLQQELASETKKLAQNLLANKLVITCVESCTGGMIAQSLTAISGSSGFFEYGFVTYSNQAKQDLVGVSDKTLADVGAVSEQVVREMSLGGMQKAKANIAVAVSGIAGPSGGSKEKPVGTVCIAATMRHNHQVKEQIKTFLFDGNREQIRLQTAIQAMKFANTLAMNLP